MNIRHKITLFQRATMTFWSLVMLLYLLPSAIQAQSNADIEGQWKINFSASYAKVRSDQKSQLDQMTPDHRQRLKANFESMLYTFNQGGGFTVTRGSMTVNGKWTLKASENLLTLIYSSGTVLEYSVVKAQAKILQIKLINSYDDSLIMKEMFLKKQ